VLAGELTIDLPAQSRLSFIPFADIEALDLDGVKWPLVKRDVPLGSTLTLSNVAHGPVLIRVRSGYGIAIAYPQVERD
jgi:thiamine pyrophosphokinase